MDKSNNCMHETRSPPDSDDNGRPMSSGLTGHEESLAMRLLSSSDSKIAAAAKRIFSSAIMNTSNVTAGSYLPSPGVPVMRDAHHHSLFPQIVTVDYQTQLNGLAFRYMSSNDSPNSLNSTSTVSSISASANAVANDLLLLHSSASSLPVGGKLMAKDKANKQSGGERLQRSRERNRMHARRTRQRKKEHMQSLQNRANELRNEQLRLKQDINEQNTVNILLVMCSSKNNEGEGSTDSNLTSVNQKVESLLKRSEEDIPNASKITELPALILPGQHNGKQQPCEQSHSSDNESPVLLAQCLPDDGINYNLLGKDRSMCSPAELDQIRRERNRMHAKRTRDRKRIFMEEMEQIIKQLEEENKLLLDHLENLGKPHSAPVPSANNIESTDLLRNEAIPSNLHSADNLDQGSKDEAKETPLENSGITVHQIEGAYGKQNHLSSTASAVSASTATSRNGSDDDDSSQSVGHTLPLRKRRKIVVPSSIVTSAHTVLSR